MQNINQFGFPSTDLKEVKIPQQVIDILETVSKKYQGEELLIALLSLANDKVRIVE